MVNFTENFNKLKLTWEDINDPKDSKSVIKSTQIIN